MQAFINPYLFMLARPPHQVVWDYLHHTQFELDLPHCQRLALLIANPALFDKAHSIDKAFLEANLFTGTPIASIEWKWDELSKIFHIGTKNLPQNHIPQSIQEWSVHYLAHCNEVLATPAPLDTRFECAAQVLIELPTCEPHTSLSGSLSDALINRKTSRSFTERQLSLSQLSSLLYLSLGHLHERTDQTHSALPKGFEARRSSPSGGGLNACEGYVYAKHVHGLKPGFYAYHSAAHALSFVSALPPEPLGQLLCGQHFINRLPAGLFITCRLDKLWWKYEHSRAYRMAYVEAGHISQTFQLIATLLGLNTWLTGAFTDDRVEALLGLHNSPEQPLFFVGCGHGDGHVQCDELMALIKTQGTQA